jgi:hypothetical protein
MKPPSGLDIRGVGGLPSLSEKGRPMGERVEHAGDRRVQTGNACIVCWRSPTDRAHLIDRSLAPDPYSDPARVVYLCREHHERLRRAHAGPAPVPRAAPPARAGARRRVFGLVGTLERVTGATGRRRLDRGSPRSLRDLSSLRSSASRCSSTAGRWRGDGRRRRPSATLLPGGEGLPAAGLLARPARALRHDRGGSDRDRPGARGA